MPGLLKPGYAVWRAAETFSGGAVTRTFALSSTVRGRASPASGGETVRAMQERGVIPWLFSTEAASDVLEGDEVRYGGRVLRVQAVRVTSTGRRKECICEEVRR